MDVPQQWPKGLLGKVEVAQHDGGHLGSGVASASVKLSIQKLGLKV